MIARPESICPHTCTNNPQQSNCYRIAPSGIVHLKHISDGIVNYEIFEGGGAVVTPGQNVGAGLYQSTYSAGAVADVNGIEAQGIATLTLPEVLFDPVTLLAITEDYQVATLPERSVQVNSGESVRFHADTGAPIFNSTLDNARYTVFGVDILLAAKPQLIVVGDDGLTPFDSRFNYTILPPEYKALRADVDLYEAGDWYGFLIGDKTQTPGPNPQIQGQAVFVRGFEFDLAKTYEAEVVLSRGSQVEIKSSKIPLPLAQFGLFRDQSEETIVGGVTDGATQLKLRLTVRHNPSALTLEWGLFDLEQPTSTKAPPIPKPIAHLGTLLDGQGNPQASVPIVFNPAGAEWIAEAVYKVPDAFVRFETNKEEGDKDEAERRVSVTLTKPGIEAGPEDRVKEIRLRRPPVLLVHGTGGSPETWNFFEPKLNQKKLFTIMRADYSRDGFSNVGSLNDNYPVMDVYIPELKNNILINNRLVVTKVDVIGHSLGGLVVRKYCGVKPIDCEQQIHKLITLGTPHLGTEIANFFSGIRGTLDFDIFVDEATGFFRGGFDGPALVEQEVGSNAIGELINTSLPVPWHMIVGQTPDLRSPYDADLDLIWNLLRSIFQIVPDESFGSEEVSRDGTGAEIAFPLFPMFKPANDVDRGRNDRLIPLYSQRFKVYNNSVSVIGGIDHVTVHDNQNPIDRVKFILEELSSNDFFRRYESSP